MKNKISNKLFGIIFILTLSGVSDWAYANEWYESMESSTLDYSAQASRQTQTSEAAPAQSAQVMTREETARQIQASILMGSKSIVSVAPGIVISPDQSYMVGGGGSSGQASSLPGGSLGQEWG